MRSHCEQSTSGEVQAPKMFNSSPIDRDEQDQTLPCNSRLSMSSQSNDSEEFPLRRERPSETIEANVHRRLHRRMVLSSEDWTSLTSSPPRAIKQETTDRNTISSSTKCTVHTSKMRKNSMSQARGRPCGLSRTRRAALARFIPVGSPLNYLIVTLALSSCFFISHMSALEGSSPQGEPNPAQSPKIQPQEAASRAPLERSEPAPKVAESTASQKSIVASLSSAVATAAAAAAVAAAQNGLSNNDARSLTSPSAHRQHAQAHRSSGLNLAIKLVDTIPEVPYNILHNMKKVDHAAPFYNVPHKFSGGAPKESTQNFLANALTASGAAEQLSVLFKSPLWKRIADGYGDFASEFRSLFRAPGATPMKGPSPTSKLLRDISVPALLMILASSMSSEWRPVRTRRKSFRPVDIATGSSLNQKNSPPAGSLASSLLNEPSASETSEQPAATQYFQRYEQNQRPQAQSLTNAQASSSVGGFSAQQTSDWLQQQQQANAAELNLGQQVSQIGQQMRIRDDISLRSLDLMPANWISPDQANSIGGSSLQSLIASNGGHDQAQQSVLDLQPSAATFVPRQAVARRSGDVIANAYTMNGDDLAEVEGGNFANQAYPFGSLAPSLISSSDQGSDAIGKLLNMGNDGHSYRMMSLLSDYNGGGMSSIKRSDQLDDQHKYSLVDLEEISGDSPSGGEHEAPPSAWTRRLQQPQQKPLLLAAVSHAVGSMLSSRSAGDTGMAKSSSAASRALSNLMGAASRSNFLTRRDLPSPMIGDQTINRDQTSQVFMRRQPQAESRDLTKLLPESWREVVKRTMTTVQQQANTQWKSIEGQLANWVQDKLKTVAASASNSASQATSSAGNSSGGSSTSAAPAPLGNMLASVSSTAMNILGLNKNNSSHSPSSGSSSSQAATGAHASQAKSQSGVDGQSAADQRGKLELTKPVAQNQQSPNSKGALAGVKNLIVSSLSLRNSSPQPSSPTQTSPSQKHNQQPTATNQTPKSQQLGEVAAGVASAALSSIANKYPTLTGTDAPSYSSPLVPTSQSASPSPATSTVTAATTPTLASQPR